MLKSEMQHQFWVTRKVVQRKLGTKEDEFVVSSDAELDAKIELFKSISESCRALYRIIDNYQERLCILAQEENALGKFLKEAGRNSNTTGKIMVNAGKSISYCGQQRMSIRPPLLRLHHEVEVFRGRAIVDTHVTIESMEKERTEYRAALSWMKSASTQLDPDTGKGLEKFRKAQTHVRSAKSKFDRLALDCLQKIDLLAAARCNMFSHALVAYMSALLQFATKSSETFKATAHAISTSPQYDFCILKDLTQSDTKGIHTTEHKLEEILPIDSDQNLFFLDEYRDDQNEKASQVDTAKKTDTKNSKSGDTALIAITDTNEINEPSSETNNLINISTNPNANDNTYSKDTASNFPDLSDDFDEFFSAGSSRPAFLPSELLLSASPLKENTTNDVKTTDKQHLEKTSDTTKNKNILDFLGLAQYHSNKNSNIPSSGNCQTKSNSIPVKTNEKKNSKKDISAWFQLFSELDPLANPDYIARKIDGGTDSSQAA